MKILVFACSIWLMASTAHADIITIDPNNFPLGTDLSEMFDGVTLSRLVNERNNDGPSGQEIYRPVASPVVVSEWDGWGRHLGLYSFVDEYQDCYGGSIFARCQGYNVLEIAFTQPTDYISIWGAYWVDRPSIALYDASGAQINALLEFEGGLLPNDNHWRRITAQRQTADVARVVVGGVVGNSLVTRVDYNETHTVPEPSTLLVMAAGAIMMLRRRGHQ
jgi:hypothetical protein